MALGVVRALGAAGIPVVVVHWSDQDMAHVSRWVGESISVPPPQADDAGLIEALAGAAPRLPGAVLMPASDEAVVTLSQHGTHLRELGYVVAAPSGTVVRNFIEKRRTYEIARDHGIPAPAFVVPDSVEAVREAGERFGFPLLLKPSQSHLFYERFRSKMRVLARMPDLVAAFEEARAAGLEVLVQEIVPGADREVVNYNAYVVAGRPVVEFTARQLRKAPPHFGSPRVVRSERIDGVLEPGRAILQAIGMREGFACTELKRDPRDGLYKVVDVNGRHNLSGRLAVRCGINFPLLQYRHLVHGEVPRAAVFEEGVYWTDVVRDVGYGLRYLLHERLAPWTWLRPYLAPSCDAILDLSDPRPFATRVTSLVRSAGHRARAALGGGRRAAVATAARVDSGSEPGTSGSASRHRLSG